MFSQINFIAACDIMKYFCPGNIRNFEHTFWIDSLAGLC